MNEFWMAAAALLLDRVIGDPLFPPHPVILMGRYITWFDRRFNRPQNPRWNRAAGVVLVVSGLVVFAGVPFMGLYELYRLAAPAAVIVGIWLIATTIAWKGLARAGEKVRRALVAEGLPEARAAVGEIVGRDTADLDEAGVIRATVETLAENLVDAIVAPVFFACLGGAPWALAYRWVNTLDAMVGHHSPRYETFGWASARADDLLNWIPARITVGLMALALYVVRQDAPNALWTVRRDGRRHESPNSGLPEAMMAGGLHVQLGGLNYYQGQENWHPLLGDPGDPLAPHHIAKAVRVVGWTSLSLVGLLVVGGIVV
ncbi:MAG: adenosylcobinamide-phosphate synthase CbiB [Clostridia bacterium]